MRHYERTRDPEIIASTIDEIVAESLRDPDALLRQGTTRQLNGVTLTQERAVNGVHYAVQAFADGKRALRVALPLEQDGTGYRTLDGVAVPRGAATHFLLAGQADASGAPSGKLEVGGHGAATLVFSLPVETYAAAHLRGAVVVGAQQIKACSGYVYAVPDDADLGFSTARD